MGELTDDERTTWWNDAYADGDIPWETGRPQPQVVAMEASGEIEGRVLDVGCGVGSEATFLADRGHEVVGVDFAARAVQEARDREADGDVTFRVADALALPAADLGTFDTVLDVGLLHALDRGDRPAYARSVASVLAPGGHVGCLAFGSEAPTDWGPTPLSGTDVRETFGDGWRVETLEPVPFETQQGVVPGVLGLAERLLRDGAATGADRSA